MNAMRQDHADGWFIVFDTLTLDDDRLGAFYDNLNSLRYYFRDIGSMVLAAEDRKANDAHADCYQYVCVPEYGTANCRLHFHAVDFFFFQAEDGIRDLIVTGVQTCALPIYQSDETVNNAGAVYVFVRSGATWTQQAYVKASNTGGGDGFGSSVALSSDGNTLAAGGPRGARAAARHGGKPAGAPAPVFRGGFFFSRPGAPLWAPAAVEGSKNPHGC